MASGDQGLTEQGAPAPEHLVIGRICRAHGLKGEVQVDVLTDRPDLRFAPGASVWIESPRGGPPQVAEVRSMRTHKKRLLVGFDVTPDRTAAQHMRGRRVLIETDEAVELDDDAFYPHELIGLDVSTLDGRALGSVAHVMETGATDVLVVQGEREVLIPMVADIVVEIDLVDRVIRVDPIPGLVD